MNKKLGYTLLKMLLILCCINVVVFVALVIAKYFLPFDPFNIVIAEKHIFLSMKNEAKNAFPHFYFIHTLLIYLLALYGGVILFLKCFKLLRAPAGRFLLYAWQYRVKFGFFFLYFFLATLLVVSVYGI
jgi:hypothetical protein